jgi:hypothetical protein
MAMIVKGIVIKGEPVHTAKILPFVPRMNGSLFAFKNAPPLEVFEEEEKPKPLALAAPVPLPPDDNYGYDMSGFIDNKVEDIPW